MNNAELVGIHGVSCGVAVVVYWGRGLEMFLYSFPQGSARLPNVGAGAVYVWALELVDDPVWQDLGSLSLGLPRAVLRVLVPLKWTWIPLLCIVFWISQLFCWCKEHYGCFVFVIVVGRVVVGVVAGIRSWWWLWLVELMLPLVKCPWGNWQQWRAVLMCVSSLSKFSWVEDTVLALWDKVLYTLCLAVMWWLLSQWRYWSVCVWVSCKLWCWMCCLVVWWLGCPGKVVILAVWAPL